MCGAFPPWWAQDTPWHCLRSRKAAQTYAATGHTCWPLLASQCAARCWWVAGDSGVMVYSVRLPRKRRSNERTDADRFRGLFHTPVGIPSLSLAAATGGASVRLWLAELSGPSDCEREDGVPRCSSIRHGGASVRLWLAELSGPSDCERQDGV